MKYIQQLRVVLLYLAVFTLPMHMRLNNILLGIFIIVSAIALLYHGRFNLKEIVFKGWPVFLFFFLAVMASFHELSLDGFKFLEKYWGLLLIPLVVIPEKDYYLGKRREIFTALVLGCAVALLICYSNLFWEMFLGKEPFNYIYRWRHVGHEFTEVADIHPTYLGLFLVTAIFYLLYENKLNRTLKVLTTLFFVAGLFQLASRMSLILLIVLVIFIFIYKLKTIKQQISMVIMAILLVIMALGIYGSRYMQNRLFSIETMSNDNRIKRWKASYEVFRDHPYWGAGYADVMQLRKEKYIQYNFNLAAQEELNSHNQLLEYLSSNGFIGGFVYIIALGYLFFLSLYRRDFLFAFLFLSFILANLTESMMVRIKGIEYFAIFATLFLCDPITEKRI